MYCEFLWADDEAGGDDAGDVWYRAFIRNKDGEKASIFYPDSGEEEQLTRNDVTPGSIRRPGGSFVPPLAPWIEEENAVDEGEKAIKALPIPGREQLDSAEHESMMTIWEAVRYIADGYGRPRASKF